MYVIIIIISIIIISIPLLSSRYIMYVYNSVCVFVVVVCLFCLFLFNVVCVNAYCDICLF